MMHWKTYLPKSFTYSLLVRPILRVRDKKNVAHLFIRTADVRSSAEEPSRHCSWAILVWILQSQAHHVQWRFCEGGGLFHVRDLENYRGCWGDCWTWSNAVSVTHFLNSLLTHCGWQGASRKSLHHYMPRSCLTLFTQWHPTQDEWSFFLYVSSINWQQIFIHFQRRKWTSDDLRGAIKRTYLWLPDRRHR